MSAIESVGCAMLTMVFGNARQVDQAGLLPKDELAAYLRMVLIMYARIAHVNGTGFYATHDETAVAITGLTNVFKNCRS